MRKLLDPILMAIVIGLLLLAWGVSCSATETIVEDGVPVTVTPSPRPTKVPQEDWPMVTVGGNWSNKLHRFVDPQAGVVCYIYDGGYDGSTYGAIDCIGLPDLNLAGQAWLYDQMRKLGR